MPNNEFKKLAANIRVAIRLARVNAGLTQLELAQQVGVAQSTIAGYETGARGVSAVNLFRITRALELPLDYFFELLSNAENTSMFPSDDTS